MYKDIKKLELLLATDTELAKVLIESKNLLPYFENKYKDVMSRITANKGIDIYKLFNLKELYLYNKKIPKNLFNLNFVEKLCLPEKNMRVFPKKYWISKTFII
jgi:hypothetical protein